MHNHFIFWIIFTIIVGVMFYIDLFITEHRKGKLGIKTSLIWSGVWISAAFFFSALIFTFSENGNKIAIEFLTGYLIEKSLSVDNLFVFLMIFGFMNVRDEHQPHVLKWGILTAIVLRIIFIIGGVALIRFFHPIIYLFGIFLMYAAFKMAFFSENKTDFSRSPIIKYFSKKSNILDYYQGKKFFVTKDKKLYFTPLFITFLLIESADLLFAVDSIPAVIAITHDPFTIITSNIFAILGLRALYFALREVVELFVYLKYGVAVILAFVGIKMLIADIFTIPTLISLAVIIICLFISIVASLVKRKRKYFSS